MPSHLDELLTGLFQSGSVLWDVRSTDKFDALREIVHSSPVFAERADFDLSGFASKVIEREELQSTGLGHGVAVAHGKTTQADEPLVALGISLDGIDFGAFDDQPVHLVFVVANHPDQQAHYLRILSTIATIVRDHTFRQELLRCSCHTEVETHLCRALTSLITERPIEATA